MALLQETNITFTQVIINVRPVNFTLRVRPNAQRRLGRSRPFFGASNLTPQLQVLPLHPIKLYETRLTALRCPDQNRIRAFG